MPDTRSDVSGAGSSNAPLPIRIIAVIGVFLTALFGWYPMIDRQRGWMLIVAMLLVYVVIAAAYGVLAVVQSSRWPLAPIRVALTLVIAFAVLMILGMPFPPQTQTIGSLVLGWVTIGFAVAAHVLIRDHPRQAAIPLAGLGLTGLYLMLAAPVLVASVATGALGPVATQSFGGVAFMAIGSLACLWYGRGTLHSVKSGL